MASTQVIRKNPSVLQRSLEGRHVLYRPDTDEAMGLDAVGSVVWDLLESGATRDHLVDALADRFDVARERIAEDLEPLLAGLVDAGMIALD